MAFVNVNVQTAKEVSHEIEALDETLINNYFVQIAAKIYDLISNANGIKSEDIKSTLLTVNDKLGVLYKDIQKNLNGLEEDIAEVLKNYEVNTQAALEKLVALFNVMQGFSENGAFDFTNSDSINYMAELGTSENAEAVSEENVIDNRPWYQRAWDNTRQNFAENEQEFIDSFSSENMKDIYAETRESDNVLSGILNGALDTVEFASGALINTADYLLSTTVDGVVGIGNLIAEAVDDASGFVVGLLNS